ncbi:MAG: hypothetical protein ACRD2J_00080 [Thermoanaerobaculia bacterium]
MESPIDEQIRRYYETQRLPGATRARLHETIRAGGASRRAGWWWWIRTAAAAVFIIAGTATAVWLTVFAGSSPETPAQIARTIAEKAALGHNQPQELDFRVSRTSELRAAMKSLDFTPVEPEKMAAMNMRVVGARYTTIEGILAAQIRYLEPNGAPCTLYLVRPVGPLANIPSGEHEIDGVLVTLWHEKGLLMVLARPLA